ncbi:hypothetical protein J2Z22_003673 [Paenibacillus forsythiae]|uniref:Uncharacterized protein n=3 Tax=Paenibacillus forsythiae TaxID=365616 RepID=A0ABU3HB77_9BACL|nr:pilus assembly protein N-terminal domain-containing protein [Paenibacillus forsythiae]MDT3428083.1 hypothetical protein [Paenibacillus forsythiae]
MKGKIKWRVQMILLAFAMLLSLSVTPDAYGYFNRGTVQLSLGSTSASVKVGSSTTISATLSPDSYTGVIGCGQAICPQQCNGMCGDEVTGQCQCAGPGQKTEEARASVSVANPFIASASYSSGTITIKGKSAGTTTVTVTGTLWQHTSSSPETISVTVEEESSGGGQAPPEDPGSGSGAGPVTPSAPPSQAPEPSTDTRPSAAPEPTPYVPVVVNPSPVAVPSYAATPSYDTDGGSPVVTYPSPAPGASAPNAYAPQYTPSPAPAGQSPDTAASSASRSQPAPYRPVYVENAPQPSPVLPLPDTGIVAPIPAGGQVNRGPSGGAVSGGNASFSGTVSAQTGFPAGSGGKPYVSAAKPYVAVIAPYVPLVAAQGSNISKEEQQEVISRMQALAPVAPKPLAGTSAVDGQRPTAPADSPAETNSPETKSMDTMRGTMKMVTLTDTGVPTGKAAMEEAREKKERLTFQKLDDSSNVLYSWTFEGETIETPEDISFHIDFPETAPALKKAASSLVKPFYISFAHDGKLPGPAEIYINTGSRFSDADNLTLYLLDAEKGRLVPAATNLNVQAGYVSFTISHNSDYVLAVGAPSYSSGSIVIVVAVGVLVVLAAAVAALILNGMKRRRRFKDAA